MLSGSVISALEGGEEIVVTRNGEPSAWIVSASLGGSGREQEAGSALPSERLAREPDRFTVAVDEISALGGAREFERRLTVLPRRVAVVVDRALSAAPGRSCGVGIVRGSAHSKPWTNGSGRPPRLKDTRPTRHDREARAANGCAPDSESS